ncbi:hypothetical protein SLS62_008054 [Diatrype stigma]|uniref:F-box domain-containing protein n=1 Tax=Diatrype stigma TaxID=117547 RepID=A0AAN9UNC9_9PEZI
MASKRKRVDSEVKPAEPIPTKKRRHHLLPDLLSPLSDELLVRVLTFLDLPDVLSVASVSRRFYELSGDSQVWKQLYYSRFVLPRALRIPGFRDGSAREGKLHYSSRKAVWADGRKGGWVDMRSDGGRHDKSRTWKRQYKLRHNWSRGKCAVEELSIGRDPITSQIEAGSPHKMLVKICEGLALTADSLNGLRAWDLKTKVLLAQVGLREQHSTALPSSLAIDDQNSEGKALDIAMGFTDGSFGVWRLDLGEKRLIRRYRHEKSSNGELIGVALSHPYLLTATKSVLISLYTFDGPPKPRTEIPRKGVETTSTRSSVSGAKQEPGAAGVAQLQSPYLLTSLKSHTSRAPLALSIRKTGPGNTIASIAYTFSTLQGWSLGIQDLHLQETSSLSKPIVDITTRLAYTMPVRPAPSYTSSPPSSPPQSILASPSIPQIEPSDGPISLCYTHPYLLATLPDNTLLLYLCTSTASALSISPGIRLWGHTSGISDAEITARGKAVSVSCRGEEIRVWELEGRTEGKSIEVKPTTKAATEDASKASIAENQNLMQWDERRYWVGFDDEMVIVLKESKGRESLMVYDFT